MPNLSYVPPAPGRRARRALAVFLFAADARPQPLALVEPHLHADLAVGGAGFREAVVDVRAQRLQRQLAVQVPLGARDFRAVQPARHAHLDPARAEAQRRLDRLAHRAAERHALFELHGDRLGDQLASSSGFWISWMLMKTSRLVRFWISCFSLSTSVPLRPMMMPGREV